MKTMVAGLGSLVLGLGLSSTALAQEQPAPPPPPVQVQEAPPPPAPAPPAPQTSWVRAYPTGQWVYTSDYGWVWVPAGTATTVVEGVPYAELYTPAYGWTWYVSPWGFGSYHYGPWVAHTWHPVGWRGGWVAHPRVAVRLGAPHFGVHYGAAVHYGGGVHYGAGAHFGGWHHR
jgi:hypothetical protein